MAVDQTTGDADTLICRTAIHKATNAEAVTVVADDTDVLVLLVHHWQKIMAEVYMKCKAWGNFKGVVISIAKVKMNVGDQVANRLPAIHAFSGCDTTAAINKLQTKQWKANENDVANPDEWGWKVINNTLTPMMTNESPGLSELMKVIRCKCKTTTRNQCGTSL